MATIKAKLAKFERDGAMPIGLAQRLISDSAYWYGHPSGPVRAPKHADRVTAGIHGWQIEFGANAFLVESAIRRCSRHVLTVIDEVSTNGCKTSAETLKKRMAMSVRGAVADFEGEEYPGFWQLHDAHMLFGTQSIHVGDFVYCYWNLAGLATISV